MFLFCLDFALRHVFNIDDQRLVTAAESLHMIGPMWRRAEGEWAELSAARFFLKCLEF